MGRSREEGRRMEFEKKIHPGGGDGAAGDQRSCRSSPTQVLPFDLSPSRQEYFDPSSRKLANVWRSVVPGIVEMKIAGKRWASAIKVILFGRSNRLKKKEREKEISDSSARTSKELTSTSCSSAATGIESTPFSFPTNGFPSPPSSDKAKGPRSSPPTYSREGRNIFSSIIAENIERPSFRKDRFENFPLVEHSSFRFATTPRSPAESSPTSSTSSRRSPRMSNSPSFERPRRSSPAAREAGVRAVQERSNSPSPSVKRAESRSPAAAKRSHSALGNVAVVRQSEDPSRDFQESMAAMIRAKNIKSDRELVNLLNCYLSLNASNLHSTIIDAFSKVCQP